MTEKHNFPFPIADLDTEQYWAACNRDELRIQQCNGCDLYRFTPGPVCGDCGSSSSKWSKISGLGELTSWTVVTHPIHPAAIARVPYIVAEVELQEQAHLRIITNLLDSQPEDLRVGLPVEVVFQSHPSGQKIPQFRPRR